MIVIDLILPALGLFLAVRIAGDAIKTKDWRLFALSLGIGAVAVLLVIWRVTSDPPRTGGGCYIDWDGRSNAWTCP